MNIRKITVAAALVTAGVLALTGCTDSGIKATGAKATTSPSSATTAKSGLSAGDWIVARHHDEITTLYDVNPKAGTFKEIDTTFDANENTLREEKVSGDSQYWVPDALKSGVTTIPVKKLGDPSKAINIDLASTLPGFGQSTAISAYRFDFTKPHTLVISVSAKQGDPALPDAVTAWGYDVTKPTKAPTKLASVAIDNVDDGNDVDDETGWPIVAKADGTTSDGEATHSTFSSTRGNRPWGKVMDVSTFEHPYGSVLQATDGTIYSFGVRDADTDATIFVSTLKSPTDPTGTAFGKPIQKLPGDFDIAWVRPITK